MTTFHSVHQVSSNRQYPEQKVYQNYSVKTQTVSYSGVEYSQNWNPNQSSVHQSKSGQYQEQRLLANQTTSCGIPNIHAQNLNGVTCPSGGTGNTDQNSMETQNTKSETTKDNSSNVINNQTSLATVNDSVPSSTNTVTTEGQNSELYKKYRIVWFLPLSNSENQDQGSVFNTSENGKEKSFNVNDAGQRISSENDVVTVSIGSSAVMNNQISGKSAEVNTPNDSVQSACLVTADSGHPPPAVTDNMSNHVLRKTLHDAYRGYKRRSSLHTTSYNVAQHASIEHSQFLSQYKADVQKRNYEPHIQETDIYQQFSNNDNIPKRTEDLQVSTLQKNRTSLANLKAEIFLVNKTLDDQLNSSSSVDAKRKAHEEYIKGLREKYLNTSRKSKEEKPPSIRKPADTTNDERIQALKEENLKKLNALRQGFRGNFERVPQPENRSPWKPRDNNDVNNHANYNGRPPSNLVSNAAHTNLRDATNHEKPLRSTEGFSKYMAQEHFRQVSRLGLPTGKTDFLKTHPTTQNTSIIDLTDDNKARGANNQDHLHSLITQRHWNPHLQIFPVANTDPNQTGHNENKTDNSSAGGSQHVLPAPTLYSKANEKQNEANQFDLRNRAAFLHPYRESQPPPDIHGYQAFRCSINIKKSCVQPVGPDPWVKTPSEKDSLPSFLKRKYRCKAFKPPAVEKAKRFKKESSEGPTPPTPSDSKRTPSRTSGGKKISEDSLHTVLHGINQCLTKSQHDGNLVNDFRNRGRKKNTVDEFISEIDMLVNKNTKSDEDVMVIEDFDVDSYMKIEKIG